LKHIPEEYQDLTIAETRLRAETGILVMVVEHTGKKAEAARADTVFVVGDTLTVFGDYTTICKAFHARERFTD
ncbi:MAG: TrkA C-terminal domain-containing protein, partial [Oscillospiraceae bacterium]|nr:TrkA C-terminal domain-containing protein [Oscillospiraceae bacterium]